jgi:hypothetical protein
MVAEAEGAENGEKETEWYLSRRSLRGSGWSTEGGRSRRNRERREGGGSTMELGEEGAGSGGWSTKSCKEKPGR